MGRETKIAFDEPLPGELVVIVLFALFLVLAESALGVMRGDTSESGTAHEFNCGREFVIEHNSHSQRKLG
jgi:hypothetical protein